MILAGVVVGKNGKNAIFPRTARTKDGKPSAQWEHTVLITEMGHEILTPWNR